jgi:hypothetical protein
MLDLYAGVPVSSDKFQLERDARQETLPAGVFAAAAPGKNPESPKTGMWYRYDSLGLGFEVVGGSVTSIALFPPEKE